MRDLRDPVLLGSALLRLRHPWERRPLSTIYDAFDWQLSQTPDYESSEGPIEKYGDPRLIPSTMPNAVG